MGWCFIILKYHPYEEEYSGGIMSNDELKAKIQTISPIFTDELLELLCEYINKRKYDYEQMKEQAVNDKLFHDLIKDMAEKRV